MIFELIDSNKICDSCYVDGKVVPFTLADNLTHSWDYSPIMGEKQYELACLYTGTKNIEDACSHEMRERYLLIRSKLKAYMKSFITAQVSLDENCFFDLVPVSFIHELFSARSAIMKEIFETKKRPENYEFLYNLNKMLHEISQNDVKFSNSNYNISCILKICSKNIQKIYSIL